MRVQITTAVVLLTLLCGGTAGAQHVSADQPLRRAVNEVGSSSTQVVTRRPPRRPINARRCVRSIGIATAVIGSIAAAAFASEAKEEDRWKVAGTAALSLGVPPGVGVGLAVCLS